MSAQRIDGRSIALTRITTVKHVIVFLRPETLRRAVRTTRVHTSRTNWSFSISPSSIRSKSCASSARRLATPAESSMSPCFEFNYDPKRTFREKGRSSFFRAVRSQRIWMNVDRCHPDHSFLQGRPTPTMGTLSLGERELAVDDRVWGRGKKTSTRVRTYRRGLACIRDPSLG